MSEPPRTGEPPIMSSPLSRRSVLLAALGLSAAGVGCRSSRHDGSKAVEQRVVSITPNTTETIYALGAGKSLVGRSRFCDYPPEVKALPAVGGYVDPSLETILALRPTLVTGARGPMGRNLVDKLETRGTQCYFPSTESIDEIAAMILGLAERLHVEAKGKRVVDSIRDHLQLIKQAWEGKPQPRTLLVFGQSPIVVAGPGAFLPKCSGSPAARTPSPPARATPRLGSKPSSVSIPISSSTPPWPAAERTRPSTWSVPVGTECAPSGKVT